MPDTIVGFTSGPKKVSLVVRGKQGPNHHPDKLDQHADCIRQNGAPIGFFGEGNDGSLNGIGLGMNGVVYDYNLFQRHYAGVVTSGIPWMDTPDNLYGQLVDQIPAGRRTSYTGFVGFVPAGGGFTVEIRPYIPSPTVNSPNQGSWGGSSGA